MDITSFDVVFTPDGRSATKKLTATNPGTYFHNQIIENTGITDITIDVTLIIPEEPGTTPAEQFFCLKGAVPVHVYSDVNRINDVTGSAMISITQPITNTNALSITCLRCFGIGYNSRWSVAIHRNTPRL